MYVGKLSVVWLRHAEEEFELPISGRLTNLWVNRRRGRSRWRTMADAIAHFGSYKIPGVQWRLMFTDPHAASRVSNSDSHRGGRIIGLRREMHAWDGSCL